MIAVLTGNTGKHHEPNIHIPAESQPHCTFTEGYLHVAMRTPTGGTMRTEFSFTGRKHEDTVHEVERSYRWWGIHAGKYGADYFVTEARRQQVHIELGRPIPADPIPPIKRARIYRHCV